MKEPLKIFEVLKALVRHSGKPVTVKIRAGWDESSVNARDTALYAQDAGVSAVFIHGRPSHRDTAGRSIMARSEGLKRHCLYR